MTHLITQSATTFCQITSAILWHHPVHNQWDKVSYFSVTNVPVVRYWGAGRQQQIARNWCRQWNAMINNKLRNFSTQSAARFLKTSPATLNEIIWSIKLTSNGSWCMGIKGEMSGTVCVTFTWDMYIYIYIYELFIAFVCFVVCSLL